jgi:PBP4 family serine-type D-alanyl-D-alanine carboxypeptidase
MHRTRRVTYTKALVVVCCFCCAHAVQCIPAIAQRASSLAQRIDKIIHQPQFQKSDFGIEVYSLETHRMLYALNAHKFFKPASTTKLVTEGVALGLLGSDHHFTTRVYRSGPILPDGTLDGFLVLVGTGDPNLSGRMQPDGKLAFTDVDHSYGGNRGTRAVRGDPLRVIRSLATQIAAHGIKKVKSGIQVDVSLFPEGERERGTYTVMSPLIVNDNVIDVLISPGKTAQSSVQIKVSPEMPYVKFINEAKTGSPSSAASIHWASDAVQPDQSHQVVVGGSFPEGAEPVLYSYAIPEPSHFAAVALATELDKLGVEVSRDLTGQKISLESPAFNYGPENMVAEHVSAALSEDVRITLKVSQNLHASVMPLVWGAALGHRPADPEKAGFDLERQFLAQAGLDLSEVSLSDGAGVSDADFFTPDFLVSFLRYMDATAYSQTFKEDLPVLGREGGLVGLLPGSPAVGHIHAKTGTYWNDDELNEDLMVTCKALAGYIDLPNGKHVAFQCVCARRREEAVLFLDDLTAGRNWTTHRRGPHFRHQFFWFRSMVVVANHLPEQAAAV